MSAPLRTLLLILLTVTLLVGPLPRIEVTQAATLTVTSTADSGPGTLRATIAAASAGDTITFAVTGTIALTSGPLVFNKSLTVSGPGASSLTIDGSSIGQVAQIGPGAPSQVALSGITVQGGTAGVASGGGMFVSAGSTLTLNSAVVQNNRAGAAGGIDNRGTLVATLVTFTGNTAAGTGVGGGALYNAPGATLTLTNSTLSANSASGTAANGGAFTNAGTATITSTLFVGNTTTGSGGAIFNGGTLTLTNSTLTGNTAGSNGGGLGNSGGATLNSVTIANNTTPAGAGAVVATSFATGTSFRNTVLGPNSGLNFSPPLLGPPLFSSQGFNLSSDDSTTGAFVTPSDQNTTPTQLGPLSPCGPTQALPPQPGSPAIGTGNSGLPVDQCGDTRTAPDTKGPVFRTGGPSTSTPTATPTPTATATRTATPTSTPTATLPPPIQVTKTVEGVNDDQNPVGQPPNAERGKRVLYRITVRGLPPNSQVIVHDFLGSDFDVRSFTVGEGPVHLCTPLGRAGTNGLPPAPAGADPSANYFSCVVDTSSSGTVTFTVLARLLPQAFLGTTVFATNAACDSTDQFCGIAALNVVVASPTLTPTATRTLTPTPTLTATPRRIVDILTSKPLTDAEKRALKVFADRVSKIAIVSGLAVAGLGYFCPPCFIVAVIPAGEQWIAVDANRLADDPPDPNYTTVARPIIPSPPAITTQSGLTAAEAVAFNALLTNDVQGIGLSGALLKSIERAQGAAQAGDVAWQIQQTQAAGNYAAELANLYTARPALLANVQQAWLAAGRPSIPISPEAVASLQAGGLPVPLAEALVQLGADSATIDSSRGMFVTADPVAVAALGGFPQALTDPTVIAATQSAAQALRGFATRMLGVPLGAPPATPTLLPVLLLPPLPPPLPPLPPPLLPPVPLGPALLPPSASPFAGAPAAEVPVIPEADPSWLLLLGLLGLAGWARRPWRE